jgi:hypothetical protein
MTSFIVTAPLYVLPDVPAPVAQEQPNTQEETNSLLLRLIELQTEANEMARQSNEVIPEKPYAQYLLDEHGSEYRHLVRASRNVLPHIERVYLKTLDEFLEKLNPADEDLFENEYAIMEMIERYSCRLSQTSQMLTYLAQMASAETN